MVKRITRRDLDAFHGDGIPIDSSLRLFWNNNADIDDRKTYGRITCQSIAGYVPYSIEHTNIAIYNFLSKNYSIRKKILLRFSLISDATVRVQTVRVLGVNEVRIVSTGELFEDIGGDIVVVEAFHPLIRPNHGGHDGHLRFWGLYHNRDVPSAIVHSMPLDDGLAYASAKGISARKVPAHLVLPPTVEIWHVDETASKRPTIEQDELGVASAGLRRIPYGYNLAVSGANSSGPGDVEGVWHDGPRYSERPEFIDDQVEDTVLFRSGVYVPPGSNRVLRVFVNPTQFGSSNPSIEFVARRDGEDVSLDRVRLDDQPRMFTLSVPEQFASANGYTIESRLVVAASALEIMHPPYFHMFYGSADRLGDNVHSLYFWWKPEVCEYVSNVISNRLSSNCLKFGLFMEDENIESNVVVHLVNPRSVRPEHRYFDVRLIHDEGEEIKRFFVDGGDVKVIGLRDFSLSHHDRRFVGVAQVESPYINFEGAFMIRHRHSPCMAVDHLTGG